MPVKTIQEITCKGQKFPHMSSQHTWFYAIPKKKKKQEKHDSIVAVSIKIFP